MGIPVSVVPVSAGALTRMLVCAPGANEVGDGANVNVRGVLAVVLTAQPVGEETMQEVQAGVGVAPTFEPEKITSQVEEVQLIVLPPLFFTVTEIADGAAVEPVPATRETPTTAMLEFDVALLTRL